MQSMQLKCESQLHYLINTSWEKGIPVIGNQSASANNIPKSELEKLGRIARLIREVFHNNPPQGQLEEVQKLINKCWRHSLAHDQVTIAMKACRICYSLLPRIDTGDNLVKSCVLPVKLFFQGTQDDPSHEYELPGYFKHILVKESIIFEKNFEGNFKEKNASNIALNEIDYKHFMLMMKMLAQNPLDIPHNWDLEELVNFTALAYRFDMKTIYPLARRNLIEAIGCLKASEEHFDISQELQKGLPVLFGSDPLIQEALDSYYTKKFKYFDALLTIVKAHGENIRTLDLRELKKLNDSQMEQLIIHCPNLKRLVIKETLYFKGITDKFLESISKNCPQLQTLELIGCLSLNGSGLVHLSKLSGLSTLNLNGCCLGSKEPGLSQIGNLRTLHTLNISNNDLTDEDLVHLAPLTALHTLELSNCAMIKGPGLAHLSTLSSLHTLNLSRMRIILENLAHLTKLNSLRTLNLSDIRTWISVDSFRLLATLSSLQALDLSGCKWLNWGEEGFHYISKLSGLQTLNLSRCEILNDADLYHLIGLTNLISLNLFETKIGDAGVAFLGVINTLQELNLGECPRVTNASLIYIENLRALIKLNLNHCFSITNAGLAHLAYARSLKILDLRGCDEVTHACLEQLTPLVNEGLQLYTDNDLKARPSKG